MVRALNAGLLLAVLGTTASEPSHGPVYVAYYWRARPEKIVEYNAYIKSFPTALYARTVGFEPQKYFEAPAEAQKVPKVDFGTPPPTSH